MSITHQVVLSTWSESQVDLGDVLVQTFSVPNTPGLHPQFFVSQSPQFLGNLYSSETSVTQDSITWKLAWVALGEEKVSEIQHLVEVRDSVGSLVQSYEISSEALPKVNQLESSVDWKVRLTDNKPSHQYSTSDDFGVLVAIIAIAIFSWAIHLFVSQRKANLRAKENHILNRLISFVASDGEIPSKADFIQTLIPLSRELLIACFAGIKPGFTFGQMRQFLQSFREVFKRNAMRFVEQGVSPRKANMAQDSHLSFTTLDESTLDKFYDNLIELVQLLDYEVLQSYQGNQKAPKEVLESSSNHENETIADGPLVDGVDRHTTSEDFVRAEILEHLNMILSALEWRK